MEASGEPGSLVGAVSGDVRPKGLAPMTWLDSRRIRRQRRLLVPLPSGEWMRVDRYFPRDAADAPLVVLTGMVPAEHDALARDIAARGYQVLVHAAPADAGEVRAVRVWLADQPWFPGAVTALAEI